MLGLGPLHLALRDPHSAKAPPRDVVILAYGQSNEQGGNLTNGAPIDQALDQDDSGRIRVWRASDNTDIAAVQPLAGSLWISGSQRAPLRAFRLAQELLGTVDGRIVIVPCAVGGARLTGGPLGPGGAIYDATRTRLADCLAAFAGAQVILSWTQGEEDGNQSISQSAYTAAFTAMLEGLRSVPGAAGMTAVLHQMAPNRFITNPGDKPGRIAIDAAHKAIPLTVPDTVFVGADADAFIADDPTHFSAQGHRDAGTRAALLLPQVAIWQSAVPDAPPVPALAGGRRVTLTAGTPPPPAYDLETRAAGSSDDWTVRTVFAPVWTAAGESFDVEIAGTQATELRLRGRSFAGAGAASGTVLLQAAAPPAHWWHPQALVHLDYLQDRAFVAGTAYDSLAAARAAGAVVQTGGIDRVPVAAPATSWTLAGTGITAATEPAANTPRYLAAVDDGADGAPVDHLAWLAEARWGTAEAALNVGVYTGGSSQLASIPDPATSKAATRNQPVRMALRAAADACIVSMDGVTLGQDTSCAVPAITQVVVGNRDNGARPWDGAVHQVLFINAEMTEAEVNAALA